MTARPLRFALSFFTIAAAAYLAVPAAQTQTPAQTTAPAQATAPPAAAIATRPALIVVLVIDQFRADYIDLYGSAWTHGLRRLIDGGARFTQAAYPYFATETCPGHATIGTGSFPRTHGMIANAWYDRATAQPTVCTADAADSVAFGDDTGVEHHGPSRLRVPTLADELRAQTMGHVMTLSIKARAAIGLAGHGGDLVAWMEDGGTWATSTAFAKRPPPSADAFVIAHPIDRDYGRYWELLRPPSTYRFDDDGLAEQAPEGWTPKFPHTLVRPAGADRIFYDNWMRTPFADAYLGDFAAAMIATLGKGPGTDYLGVSFSAADYVGHRFGPRSWEVQDTLARLDVTIGHLLDALDTHIGRGRYVVALSADHGVAPIPEQQIALGLGGGRFLAADIQKAVEAALTAAIGSGPHFMSKSQDSGNNWSDMYFTSETLAALDAKPSAKRAVQAAAEHVPGIARAIWATDLPVLDDPDARALSLSYRADRSGDLLLISAPYWMPSTGGTSHGTMYAYDQRVPLMLTGPGITPGRYPGTASPADIAPTLAFLSGVTLAYPDGRVLSEALARR